MIVDIIAKRIANYFIRENIIKNDDEYEIFIYGISIIFPYYFECIVVIIISIIFNNIKSSIIYIIIFGIIRDYVGGYHANSIIKCMLLYIFNYLLIVVLSKNIVYNTHIHVLFYVCNILLIIIKPVRLTSKKYYYMSMSENRFNLLIIILIENIINYFFISINLLYLSLVLMLCNFCVLFYLVMQVFINILVHYMKKRFLNFIKELVFGYVINSLTKVSLKGQYYKDEPDSVINFVLNNIYNKK